MLWEGGGGQWYFEIACLKMRPLSHSKSIHLALKSIVYSFTFYENEKFPKTQIYYLNFKTKFHSRAACCEGLVWMLLLGSKLMATKD
jgi:hypothetical protein